MDFDELEKEKLFKKLEWLELEYKFNSHLIDKEDSNFLKEVDKKRKELNLEDKSKPLIKDENFNNIDIDKEDIYTPININKDNLELKKIYRDIVKLTHPDKSSNIELNKIYLSATEFYESGNLDELYLISLSIGLKVPETLHIKSILNKKITDLEEKINFLKTTFTWKWFNSKSEKEKNFIVEQFTKR
jgi:hypothetical protein